jgi:V/A-type H+-transporting ATPase subunit I
MIELFPDQRFLSEIGWITSLGAMLALIWYLLFIGADRVPPVLWWIILGAFFLSSCFGHPVRNPFLRLILGFSSSLLPLLNTFGDIMSYLRLFAVGLASYFIASAFNTLSVQVAEAATWIAAIPLLVFGHGLNLGLAVIAIFAHGVRLNMLEFSNHIGAQWNGYAYRPFNLESIPVSGEELK